MQVRCFILAALISAYAFASTPTTKPAEPRTARVRIALAGDSTVNAGSGWGAAFTELLKQDVECVNFALNGRSTKSFEKEGVWKKVLASKPDYILIQFGHNDQKVKTDRGTEPQGAYKQYLMQFIDEARAIDATPILVTSLSRRAFESDGKIHDTLGPYVDAAQEVAADKKVPVLELHQRSIELYEQLGKQACEEKISARLSKDGSVDNTHLSDSGAKLIAPLVVEELKKAVPALAGEFVDDK